MRHRKLNALEAQFAAELIDCADYQSFLKTVFSISTRELPFFNHTYFCQKAGFRSRNTVRELIAGRKRLTLPVYVKVMQTLDLSVTLARFMQLLVSKDHPELEPPPQSLPFAIDRQRRAVANLAKKRAHTEKSVMSDRRYLEVYAASGTDARGASADEIKRRTKLSASTVQTALIALCAKDLLKLRDGRYYPCSPHVFLEALGDSSSFRASYIQTLEDITRRQERLFARGDTLFFQSVFCVRQRDLPELSQVLKKAVASFVESHIVDEGDTVAKLVVGFHA